MGRTRDETKGVQSAGVAPAPTVVVAGPLGCGVAALVDAAFDSPEPSDLASARTRGGPVRWVNDPKAQGYRVSATIASRDEVDRLAADLCVSVALRPPRSRRTGAPAFDGFRTDAGGLRWDLVLGTPGREPEFVDDDDEQRSWEARVALHEAFDLMLRELRASLPEVFGRGPWPAAGDPDARSAVAASPRTRDLVALVWEMVGHNLAMSQARARGIATLRDDGTVVWSAEGEDASELLAEAEHVVGDTVDWPTTLSPLVRDVVVAGPFRPALGRFEILDAEGVGFAPIGNPVLPSGFATTRDLDALAASSYAVVLVAGPDQGQAIELALDRLVASGHGPRIAGVALGGCDAPMASRMVATAIEGLGPRVGGRAAASVAARLAVGHHGAPARPDGLRAPETSGDVLLRTVSRPGAEGRVADRAAAPDALILELPPDLATAAGVAAMRSLASAAAPQALASEVARVAAWLAGGRDPADLPGSDAADLTLCGVGAAAATGAASLWIDERGGEAGEAAVAACRAALVCGLGERFLEAVFGPDRASWVAAASRPSAGSGDALLPEVLRLLDRALLGAGRAPDPGPPVDAPGLAGPVPPATRPCGRVEAVEFLEPAAIAALPRPARTRALGRLLVAVADALEDGSAGRHAPRLEAFADRVGRKVDKALRTQDGSVARIFAIAAGVHEESDLK